MADILIRGMEMPHSCKCCPCYEQSLAFPNYIKRCKFGADLPQPWPLQYEKRGDNCPLVELPEHGDLIDRDEYRMSLDKTLIYENDIGKDEGIKIGLQKAYSRLVDAPVIVPASEMKA